MKYSFSPRRRSLFKTRETWISEAQKPESAVRYANPGFRFLHLQALPVPSKNTFALQNDTPNATRQLSQIMPATAKGPPKASSDAFPCAVGRPLAPPGTPRPPNHRFSYPLDFQTIVLNVLDTSKTQILTTSFSSKAMSRNDVSLSTSVSL